MNVKSHAQLHITLQLNIPIYAEIVMKFLFLKEDDKNHSYKKIYSCDNLAYKRGLFYCPSPTIGGLQNMFPNNISHVKMAVISFLGIFRLENSHIPWIGGSTESNIELPMTKHILFQVNANSWKSLSLGPISGDTTTYSYWKLPESKEVIVVRMPLRTFMQELRVQLQ